eukprot:TRINITY_DN3369_c1_g1_i4.p1 TRINITY_DN3369_c1_g1~~TRINITY_DN3369_c1_g1_i4.p1  ORF type:complete len:454 (+),score=160.49 TRINITY_DN3369_c1_g1_i4:590-1951(+)
MGHDVAPSGSDSPDGLRPLPTSTADAVHHRIEALRMAQESLKAVNSLLEHMRSTMPEVCRASQLESAQNTLAGLVHMLQQQQTVSMFPPPRAPALMELLPMQLALPMFAPFDPAARPRQTYELEPSALTLDSFDMKAIIGTGTFAKVKVVTLKEPPGTPPKHFVMKIMDKAKIVQMKQTLHISNERAILGSVTHPFIVKLYRTFQDQRNLYLLQELVPGGELFDYIRKAERLPNWAAKIYAAEITLALGALHKNHIVYRDLKPENLLIDDYGHIKLTDFGFAKRIRERTFSMCGTPDYMAPEIVLQQGHDAAADLWSLGVLIYEMLCGYPPFMGDPREAGGRTTFERILSDEVDIPDHVVPEARDLMLKLLQKNKATRLGCGPKGQGAEDVKRHPWFADINFQALEERRAPGPLNPHLWGTDRVHNFLQYPPEQVPQTSAEPVVDFSAFFQDF